MRAILRLCLTTVLALGITGVAHSDTYTLSNSHGGDGFIAGSAPSFQLWGADNGVGANTTIYSATATAAETVTFSWAYMTFDCCGSVWDPAGYVLNGVYTQLSTNSFVPLQLNTSGITTVNLIAGDVFGFYVSSLDSFDGRGEMSVEIGTPASAVPEPGTLLLIGSGLVGLAGAARRKLMS